jgi:hypothetical protein
MAGRKKRLSIDAKPVTISLGAEERVALQLIEARRQRRQEDRDSPSEIVADALWHFLERVEKLSREQISALLPSQPTERNGANVKQFPKRPKT